MTIAKKGLDGIVFDETSISKAIPDEKALIYRGYPVAELATEKSFEEVVYLLWHGELPNKEQLKEFCEKERANRALPKELIETLSNFPQSAHPMDAVRTAISYLGLHTDYTLSDKQADYEKGISLLAKTPTIVACLQRLRWEKSFIEPSNSLSFSDNFFQMCFESTPDERTRKAFDGSLTLYAEHGFNASTFTARVITSSMSDMCSAITGAIGSLKGPLHGGANEAVMHMLEEIGSEQNVDKWLTEALESKKKIMGFGHRLYRLGDSRVPTMKEFRNDIAAANNETKLLDLSDKLEKEMYDRKKIVPNLDFPAGPTYFMMGFDIPIFTPIFVMARMSGWVAHVVEQYSSNRLVRPLSHYVGHPKRELQKS